MNDPTDAEVAARLSLIIGRFNRRMMSATGGLSYGLLSSLSTIAKRGPLRLAELASMEQVSAPSITRVVAELENRGIISRTVHPDDGRAFLIEVTPKGSDAALRARAARATVVSETLSSLDEAGMAAIGAALAPLEQVIGGEPLASERLDE